MDKREDFNLDFDFEKEYGFDPNLMNNQYEEEPAPDDDTIPAPQPEADFSGKPQNELSDLSDFSTLFEQPGFDDEDTDSGSNAQDENDADSGEFSMQHRRRNNRERRPNPITSQQTEEPQSDEPAAPSDNAQPVADEAPAPRPESRRRRKRTKQQIFKEVYLPPIIAGTALVLILIMIAGAIVRAVNNGGNHGDEGGKHGASQAELDAEAKALVDQAALLAAGYDYDAAIALLDTFSGEQSAYPEMLTARSSYAQAKGQLIEWRDPTSVPNLSFHVLIADPSRAFTDESLGKSYNKNFVTIDEFEKILQQLYDNNYVLVGLEDLVFSTTTDGNTTYTANTIYLPDGKKPIMLTETMVNYYGYMVDGDGDGKADAGGDGFASRLLLDENGEITAEMITAIGSAVYGNYDLVPILNDFIKEHPDFSYRGARAILAVSGKDGVFGYRTNTGDAAEIEAAKEVIAALREDGYTIACYTYDDINYGSASATEIQADLQKWSAEVTPVLGNVDVLVYAKASDITDYRGNQYNVLYNAGFRYFFGAANSPWAQVSGDYFHQRRIMVTGTQMAHGSNVYSNYFNAMAVLNSSRGNVPQ